MTPFRPLLAATIDHPEQLIFPLVASPKLDGIRCIIHDGVAVSRNLKPIRNTYIQEQLKGLPDGLDGELIVGSPNEGLVLNRTVSGVMSEGGQPDFMFHVFDLAHEGGTFKRRYDELHRIKHDRLVHVPHIAIGTPEMLTRYEQATLEDGYEGIMVRDPNGIYKNGRSTVRDRIMGKIKRFTDGELFITQVGQGVRNENEQTRGKMGESTRSMAQSGMVPSGLVGTILGYDTKTNEAMQLSPGRMTHDMRKYYWENQEKIIGRIAHYRAFAYGSVNTPRFPTFQHFREDL